jgi:hypothetical protein
MCRSRPQLDEAVSQSDLDEDLSAQHLGADVQAACSFKHKSGPFTQERSRQPTVAHFFPPVRFAFDLRTDSRGRSPETFVVRERY